MKLPDFTFLKSAFTFVTARWQMILIGLSAVLLSYQVGSCTGYGRGKAVMQQAIDRANTAALQAQRHADELAATQRLTDTIAVNRQEGALRDAIRSTPDTQPDPVRIALGCQRLRASGQDTAHISACAGSPGRAQAGPAR